MNIKKAKSNLKNYIKEDPLYSGKQKVASDFDKFCYEHCNDISALLDYVKKLEEKIGVDNES